MEKIEMTLIVPDDCKPVKNSIPLGKNVRVRKEGEMKKVAKDVPMMETLDKLKTQPIHKRRKFIELVIRQLLPELFAWERQNFK